VLFFHGVQRYDPVGHHPPPPGYPVFMGAGKAVRAVMPSDFAALRLISMFASAIGFVMLALAFRNLAGDLAAGIAGSALFYFSPVMLVHAAVPISDPGALALLASALYFGSRNSPAAFALFAALAVGWRIQFAIFVVPLFLIAVLMMKRWRERWVALATFTAVCLAWLVPLTIAVGGVEDLIQFQVGQGKYLAAQDADQSRSGWTPARLAFRFIAHPWGVKTASFPLLVAAAIGFGISVKSRRWGLVPLTIAGGLYIAFALRFMDPADGVRYALPFVLVVGFFAGVGASAIARALSFPIWVLPAVFAAGSLAYVSSVLYQRATTPSPPIRAIEYARRTYPPEAIATYDLPLWPHATYFLRDYTPQRLDDALAKYYDRPEVPMFLFADGAAGRGRGATFAWAPSDAYSKLTRNHYRVASIIPIPAESRFRKIRGVYSLEREPYGLAWRWLASTAEMQLPRGGSRTVSIEFGLPADSVIETNEVAVLADGAAKGTFPVERGKRRTVEVSVPAGAPILTFRSARSFVPAETPGSLSRDPRPMSVMMLGLETRPDGPR
jgi:hypothetical protein